MSASGLWLNPLFFLAIQILKGLDRNCGQGGGKYLKPTPSVQAELQHDAEKEEEKEEKEEVGHRKRKKKRGDLRNRRRKMRAKRRRKRRGTEGRR